MARPRSWIPSWDPSTGGIQALQLIPSVRAHSSSACLGGLKTDALCLVMLCHESKFLEGQRELPPVEMSASWHPKYLLGSTSPSVPVSGTHLPILHYFQPLFRICTWTPPCWVHIIRVVIFHKNKVPVLCLNLISASCIFSLRVYFYLQYFSVFIVPCGFSHSVHSRQFHSRTVYFSFQVINKY